MSPNIVLRPTAGDYQQRFNSRADVTKAVKLRS